MLLHFSCTTKEKNYTALQNLDAEKWCEENEISKNIIKSKDDIFSNFKHHKFNNSLFNSAFPLDLKMTDTAPIHKDKSKLDIENYRPVSILSFLSKIYEKRVFDEMYNYFTQILSKHQYGFWQHHTTQHSLLFMIK